MFNYRVSPPATGTSTATSKAAAPTATEDHLVDPLGGAGADAVQMKPATGAVQMEEAGSGAALKAIAPPGGGGGAPLPDPVRGKMERSFGADFSDVSVHQGGHVSEVGAKAYAAGTDLHFAPGAYDPQSASGQQLIGHELSHVVQQRAGRVAGGQAKPDGSLPVVQSAGLEQQADQAGARAARGEAAGIGGGGGTIGSPVVQGYFEVDSAQLQGGMSDDLEFSAQQRDDEDGSFLNDLGATNIVHKDKDHAPDIRVSDNGKMAIESTDLKLRQPKQFFMEASMVQSSNSTLAKTGSKFRLVQSGGTIKVPEANSPKLHTLVAVVGQNVADDSQGDGMNSVVNCDEMAGDVAGWGAPDNKRLKLKGESREKTPEWRDEEGHRAGAYFTEYAKRKDRNDWTGKRSGAARASKYGVTAPDGVSKSYELTLTTANADALELHIKGPMKIGAVLKVDDTHLTVWCGEDDKPKIEQLDAVLDVTVVKETTTARPPTKSEIKGHLEGTRDQIAQDYVGAVTGAHGDEHAKDLGINQFAEPSVGDSYVTFAMGSKGDDGKVFDHHTQARVDSDWGQHWGGVVAVSGGDRITLENYDRTREDNGKVKTEETRGFFQMYGTATGQTWHDKQQGFANKVSLVYRNHARTK